MAAFRHGHIGLTNFDPFADAFSRTSGAIQSIQQMLGMYPGNVQQQTAQAREAAGQHSNDNNPFKSMFNNSYPLIKGLYALVTREDPGLEGRSLDTPEASIAGVSIPNLPFIPSGVTKYLLEATIPQLGQLNRFNPRGMFGTTEVRDEYGRITRVATPSIFGARRTDSDARMGDGLENTYLGAFRALGMTVTLQNVARNMQLNEAELRQAQREIAQLASATKSAAEKEADPARRQELVDRYLQQMAIAEELKNGAVRGAQWLEQRNVPTSRERSAEAKQYSDDVDTLIEESLN
jgi:hypothetical protein